MAYKGLAAVLGQNVISGVVPDAKFTVLVRTIWVTRVPFPDEDIIVPFPAPEVSGLPV